MINDGMIPSRDCPIRTHSIIHTFLTPIRRVPTDASFSISTVDVYAFLVVFVLPLNSAMNPILYTFTTPKYRNQILLRGWNKLTSRKTIKAGDGSGLGSGNSNQGESETNTQDSRGSSRIQYDSQVDRRTQICREADGHKSKKTAEMFAVRCSNGVLFDV